MKKIIIFIFLAIIFSINCFSSDFKISDKFKNNYRNEIHKIIKTELPKTKKNIDKEYSNALKVYNTYKSDKNKSKNVDKYIFIIQDSQRGIEEYETTFISKLIDVTDKYINISKDIPPTDFPGTLLDFIIPYFDANNIDYNQINKLDSYSAYKIKELDILMDNM